MALGAKAYKNGRVYNSLGSSSWIAVSSDEPLLESKVRPYVFAHVVPGQFASALCVTAGGTAFRWFRDQLGQMEKQEAARGGSRQVAHRREPPHFQPEPRRRHADEQELQPPRRLCGP